MFTGKHVRITRPLLGLDKNEQGAWVTIPAGSVIDVLTEPYGHEERLTDVAWDGRSIAALGADLTNGATEVEDEESN